MIKTINHKNIYYPPGGILMWIIIFLELFTFGMALIAMVFIVTMNLKFFIILNLLLNTTFGTINTIFLTYKWFFYGIVCKKFKGEKCSKKHAVFIS